MRLSLSQTVSPSVMGVTLLFPMPVVRMGIRVLANSMSRQRPVTWQCTANQLLLYLENAAEENASGEDGYQDLGEQEPAHQERVEHGHKTSDQNRENFVVL